MESLLFATYINSDINYFLRRDDAMYSIQALKSLSLTSWVLGLQAHTNVPLKGEEPGISTTHECNDIAS